MISLAKVATMMCCYRNQTASIAPEVQRAPALAAQKLIFSLRKEAEEVQEAKGAKLDPKNSGNASGLEGYMQVWMQKILDDGFILSTAAGSFIDLGCGASISFIKIWYLNYQNFYLLVQILQKEK